MSRLDALCTALAYIIAALLGQVRRDQVHARMIEIVRDDDGHALTEEIDNLAEDLERRGPIVAAACQWRDGFEATYGGRPAEGTALRPLWDAVGGFRDDGPADGLKEVETALTGRARHPRPAAAVQALGAARRRGDGGMSRLLEAPKHLRAIADDIEARHALSATILRLIAEDVEEEARVLPLGARSGARAVIYPGHGLRMFDDAGTQIYPPVPQPPAPDEGCPVHFVRAFDGSRIDAPAMECPDCARGES